MPRDQKREFDVETQRDVTAANNCLACPMLRRVFCIFSCSQEIDKVLSDNDLGIEKGRHLLPTMALPRGSGIAAALVLLLVLLVVGCLSSP
jgi:hypothetical protein